MLMCWGHCIVLDEEKKEGFEKRSSRDDVRDVQMKVGRGINDEGRKQQEFDQIFESVLLFID
jgi:hypothetical protein